MKGVTMARIDLINNPTGALFNLGHIVATPGALELLEENFARPDEFILRHVSGDWGDLNENDTDLNNRALLRGDRILSRYWIGVEVIYIITEADRSVTTILIPDEY
jgi:hypothetical protein